VEGYRIGEDPVSAHVRPLTEQRLAKPFKVG